MSLFRCPACPLRLITTAVNQASRSPEGPCSSKAPSKHFIWSINSQTLCKKKKHLLAQGHEMVLIVQMKISRSDGCRDGCIRVTFVHLQSPASARMKAEQREASWVIFNPAMLLVGIITFLLHSRTCLSS